jgi:hypothetical protein
MVSLVTDDAVIDTIYLPDSGTTAFAVRSPDGIRVVSHWPMRGVKYAPVRPSNNLIKHAALLLPPRPIEFGDPATLVSHISAYIRRYVGLSDQALGLSASYVLLSWVYDAFNELPYLRYRGDYGTGKTRALITVGALCYKAFFASGASTVSPIFHTLDTFRGTLVFDEADFRFTDEKAELVKILNNGNAKGFPVLRTQMTPQKEFDPRAFTIFGPKIVGMRRAYEDRALESRFLTIELEPGRAGGMPINLPETQAEEARALRGKLLTYRLRHRLSTAIDPTLADPVLEPRLNQILLPLLSVAPTPRLRELIVGAAKSLQADVILERAGTPEGQMVSLLERLVREEADAIISVAQIAAAFTEAHGADYERPITNRWIGTVLRRLGLALYKRNGVVVLVPGQAERIRRLCERYGVGNRN